MPKDAPVAARRRGWLRGRSLRWCGLLALLLASNLGFGIRLWLDGDRHEPVSNVVRPQSVPMLHLLGERRSEARSAPRTATGRQSPPAPASSASQASTSSSADGDANAPSIAVGQLAAGSLRRSELSQTGTQASAAAIKQAGIRSQYACVALGPFNTQDDARSASVAWRELGTRQRVRRELSTLTRRWWVYLPPQSSRAQAIARAQQLHARGISDYFVLGSGGQQSVVSLGLFKDRGNAYKRRDQVEGAGFPAQVAERGEAAAAYWLDVAVADDGVHPGWRVAIRNRGIGMHLTGRRVTAESCFNGVDR